MCGRTQARWSRRHDSGRMLKGYGSRRGSAPGSGVKTGPTRAPNLPPTRYLRRQSLGTSLSSYDPVLGEIALDAPLLHHCVAAHHRPGPPIR